jgi:hypothetical protein
VSINNIKKKIWFFYDIGYNPISLYYWGITPPGLSFLSLEGIFTGYLHKFRKNSLIKSFAPWPAVRI